MKRLFENDGKLLLKIMEGCNVFKFSPDLDIWHFDVNLNRYRDSKNMKSLIEQIRLEYPEPFIKLFENNLEYLWIPTSSPYQWKISKELDFLEIYSYIREGSWIIYKSENIIDDIDKYFSLLKHQSQEEINNLVDSGKVNGIKLIAIAFADCIEIVIGRFIQELTSK